jgi:transcriptional regulator with XRE-family HTH domain
MRTEVFRQRLKACRKHRKLSQGRLAKLLNCHRITVLHWEKGRQNPPLPLLIDLADELRISLDWLLGRDEYVSLSDRDAKPEVTSKTPMKIRSWDSSKDV